MLGYELMICMMDIRNMEWIITGTIILPIIVGVWIKIALLRRLKGIEGVGGVHKKNENVVGSLGD